MAQLTISVKVNSGQLNTLGKLIDDISSKAGSLNNVLSNIGGKINTSGIKSVEASLSSLMNNAKSSKSGIEKIAENVNTNGLKGIDAILAMINAEANATKGNVSKIGTTVDVSGLNSIDSKLAQLVKTAQATQSSIAKMGTHVDSSGIDSLSSKIDGLSNQIGSQLGGAINTAITYLGGTSLSDLTVFNALDKEVNKVLINGLADSATQAKSYWNTIDQATNNALVSMRQAVPAINAIQSATGASGSEMEKASPNIIAFGSYVQSLTGSSALAETAMFSLSKGINGAYAALDQYGVTEESLMKTGLWDGSKEDVEGFTAAVVEATGAVKKQDDLMNTRRGKLTTMYKQLSVQGAKMGEDILDAISPLIDGFINLNKSGDGIAAKLTLIAGGGAVLIGTLGALKPILINIKDTFMSIAKFGTSLFKVDTYKQAANSLFNVARRAKEAKDAFLDLYNTTGKKGKLFRGAMAVTVAVTLAYVITEILKWTNDNIDDELTNKSKERVEKAKSKIPKFIVDIPIIGNLVVESFEFGANIGGLLNDSGNKDLFKNFASDISLNLPISLGLTLGQVSIGSSTGEGFNMLVFVDQVKEMLSKYFTGEAISIEIPVTPSLNMDLTQLTLGISGFVEGIRTTLNQANLIIQEFFSGSGLDLGSYPIVTMFQSMLSQLGSSVISGASSIVSGFRSSLVSGFNGAISSARNVVSRIPGVVRSAISSVPGIVRSIFNRVPGAIRGVLGSAVSAARSIGSRAVAGIRGGLSGLVGAVRGIFNRIPGAIRGVIGSVVSAAASLGRSAVSAVKSAMGIGSPGTIANMFATEVKTYIPQLVNRFIPQVTAKLKKLAEAAIKTTKDILGIGSPGHIAKLYGKEVGTYIPALIKKGIPKVMAAFKELATNSTTTLLNNLTLGDVFSTNEFIKVFNSLRSNASTVASIVQRTVQSKTATTQFAKAWIDAAKKIVTAEKAITKESKKTYTSLIKLMKTSKSKKELIFDKKDIALLRLYNSTSTKSIKNNLKMLKSGMSKKQYAQLKKNVGVISKAYKTLNDKNYANDSAALDKMLKAYNNYYNKLDKAEKKKAKSTISSIKKSINEQKKAINSSISEMKTAINDMRESTRINKVLDSIVGSPEEIEKYSKYVAQYQEKLWKWDTSFRNKKKGETDSQYLKYLSDYYNSYNAINAKLEEYTTYLDEANNKATALNLTFEDTTEDLKGLAEAFNNLNKNTVDINLNMDGAVELLSKDSKYENIDTNKLNALFMDFLKKELA